MQLSRIGVVRCVAVVLLVAMGGAGLLGLSGCRDRGAEPAVGTDAGTAVVEYTTRAIITKLPSVAEPDQLFARHEAIPEYRQTSGRYGMDVMVMPFPLPESGVSIEGLTVGDAVAIRFAVTYSADFSSLKGYVVRSIERLPEDTELDFTRLAEIEGFDPDTGGVGAGAEGGEPGDGSADGAG